MTSAPLSLQPLLSKHCYDIISEDWKWGLPGVGRGGADMFRFETGSVTQRGDGTERERGETEGEGGATF